MNIHVLVNKILLLYRYPKVHLISNTIDKVLGAASPWPILHPKQHTGRGLNPVGFGAIVKLNDGIIKLRPSSLHVLFIVLLESWRRGAGH